MGTRSIKMCLSQVHGNVTCVVVRSMSVVMRPLTYVRDVVTKGISMNTVHNKSDFSLQDNNYLYHLCNHGRKVLQLRFSI